MINEKMNELKTLCTLLTLTQNINLKKRTIEPIVREHNFSANFSKRISIV